MFPSRLCLLMGLVCLGAVGDCGVSTPAKSRQGSRLWSLRHRNRLSPHTYPPLPVQKQPQPRAGSVGVSVGAGGGEAEKPNRITTPLRQEDPSPATPPSPPSQPAEDFPQPSVEGQEGGPPPPESPEERERAENETREAESASEEVDEPPLEVYDKWTQRKWEEQQASRQKASLLLLSPDGSARVVEADGGVGGGGGGQFPPAASPGESEESGGGGLGGGGGGVGQEGGKVKEEGRGEPSPPEHPASSLMAVQATQRNYASVECGAKILLTNPEAQHSAAVLNEKERDAYLLNPCNTLRYFYLELCDTVAPSRLDLANFELFSSGPKEVRVLASERYPSQDWHLLANVTAADNRDIQSFPISLPPQIYVKFLKVELLSHYGSEHFCPLSLIRLFGVSMVEILDEIHSEPPPPPPQQQTPAPTPETPPPKSTPTPTPQQASTPAPEKESEKVEEESGVIDKAKNLAIRVINKVLGNDSEQSLNGSACEGSTHSQGSLEFWARTCLISEPLDSSLCHYFAPKPIFLNLSLSSEAERERRPSSEGEDHRPESPPHQPEQTSPAHRRPLQPYRRPTFPHSLRIRRYDQFLRLMSELRAKRVEAERKAKARVPLTLIVNDSSIPLKEASVVPGGPVNSKESLFVRLNNRVKNLEMNISLSGQYLSELSKRYRKTLEDIQKQYNRTMREVQETRAASDSGLLELAEEVESLRAQVEELAEANGLYRQHQLFVQEELYKWVALATIVACAFCLLLVYLSSPLLLRRLPAQPLAPPQQDEAIAALRRELELLRSLMQEQHPGLCNGHSPRAEPAEPVESSPSSEDMDDVAEEELGSDSEGHPSTTSQFPPPTANASLASSSTVSIPGTPEREAKSEAESSAPASSPSPSSLSASPTWSTVPTGRQKPRGGEKSTIPPALANDNLFRFLATTPERATKPPNHYHH